MVAKSTHFNFQSSRCHWQIM